MSLIFNPAPAAAAGGVNQYTIFLEKLGPASYATGGFVIDLTGSYTTVNSFKMAPKKGTRGNVPFGRFEYKLNVPSAGMVTVLVRKYQFTRTSALGTPTGQPAGVTVLAASGGLTSTDAHTHSATHDHAAQVSAAPAAGGGGMVLAVGAPAINTHTHSVDVPSFILTSTSTTHSHTDNSIYAHNHSVVRTNTNVSQIELPAATDLSATTFFCAATGVRA